MAAAKGTPGKRRSGGKPPPPELDIGAGLRRLRLAKGAGLMDIARAAGTDAGNLSRVERNAQTVSFKRLVDICAALDIDIADFLRYVRRWQGIRPDYRGRGKAKRLVHRAERLLAVFGDISERDQEAVLQLACYLERSQPHAPSGA